MHDLTNPNSKRVISRVLGVVALGAIIVSHSAYALGLDSLSLRILDAQGKPVANAVVIVPLQAKPDAGAVEPSSYSVDQVDLQFKPHVSLVSTGKPVFFPNSDRTRHHVYSFSEPNNFELKLYREKDAPPVVFKTEGVVELGCNIHDSMKGYIYVSDAPVQAVSDQDGEVYLALNSALVEPLPLLVWHPQMGAKGPASYLYDLSSSEPLRLTLTLPDKIQTKPSSLKERLQQFKKHHD